MQKPRQKHTLEFKQKAVELVNKYCNTIRASQEMGTSSENIKRWKAQLENGILGRKTKQTLPNRLLQLKGLRKELALIKIERDILRKATHILPSETLIKFKFIKQHGDCYPVANICKILGISKSGYYYWNDREPSKRTMRNLALIEQIKIIHYRNKER